MTKSIQHYWELAEELRERDRGLRKMQARMDDMNHLVYSLPPPLDAMAEMRAVITTAPYDAVRASVRALSGLDERLKLDPASVLKAMTGEKDPNSETARKIANMWEDTLKWQMDLASRRKAILREEMVRSAVLYDEIVAQVVHLPTQIRAIEKLGGNAARQKAALANGQFAVLIRNPQNVHTIWSDYMLEGVEYVRVMEPQEIVDFWGKRASKLNDKIEAGKAADTYLLFDFVNYDDRVVFAVPGNGEEDFGGYNEDDTERIDIMQEPWGKPFLGWASVVGGTQMDSDPERQRFPLLYSIYRSEQWITTNIVRSLEVSQAIAEAGAPERIITGPEPSSVEVRYGEFGGQIEATAGHVVQPLPQRTLDPALREAGDQLESAIMASTIPRILVTAEAAPGEPFSGYNLRVQQALAALTPFKRLAERGFASIYRTMLMWSMDSGDPIECHSAKTTYKIQPEQIDPEALYFEVELTPDVPLDRQQRIQSALMASKDLPLPARDILTMLGETDPEAKVKDWFKEQLFRATLQGVQQSIIAQFSGALQQAAQQLAQQQIQQQAQQAQTGQPSQQPGLPQIPGIGGQGMNPAAGGQPPAGAFPAGTREMQTGQTAAGEPTLA